MLSPTDQEMSTAKDVREIFTERGIRPLKKEGQHFLLDDGIAARMLEYADVRSEDVVLEIGAGVGNLTEKLERRAKKVIAVEKDSRLCEVLRERCKNAEILQGDILDIEIPPFNKVVANIPFALSSPITLRLLLFHDFDVAVMMYQREFAEKMVAKRGEKLRERGKTKKLYGRLSVIVQTLAEVEILEFVPRRAFFPQPAVDAAIVRLKPRSVRDLETTAEKTLFASVVSAAFDNRRKKLKNIPVFKHIFRHACESSSAQDEWLRSIADLRPEELQPADFVRLSRAIWQLKERSGREWEEGQGG